MTTTWRDLLEIQMDWEGDRSPATYTTGDLDIEIDLKPPPETFVWSEDRIYWPYLEEGTGLHYVYSIPRPVKVLDYETFELSIDDLDDQWTL